VGQEAVFGGVVLVVQGVQNHEVRLRRPQFEEGAVVGHVDAEQGDVEVVAVVVQEPHQQPGRGQGRTHFQIPLVHVGHQQKHSGVGG